MGHSPLDKLKKIVYNKATTERKEMIKMEEKRTKVMLRDNGYNCNEVNLLLTDDQIRLLEYLYNGEFFFESVRYEICPQDWQKI
jgi:hypothetical protein